MKYIGMWREIIMLTLLVVILIQNFAPELPKAEAVVYERACEGMECDIERLTLEYYERDHDMNMEMARLEALRTLNGELLTLSSDSPYVDYAIIE
jgi:competence protein ComGC